MHELPTRSCRSGTGPYRWRSNGTGIPTTRFAGKAAQADGGMGALLRATEGCQGRRDCPGRVGHAQSREGSVLPDSHAVVARLEGLQVIRIAIVPADDAASWIDVGLANSSQLLDRKLSVG